MKDEYRTKKDLIEELQKLRKQNAKLEASKMKQPEHKIKDTKNFLENLFRTTADGIMATDHQSYITMVNKSTAKMLGYSQDELIGKYMGELSPKENNYKERIKAFTTKLFEEGIITNYQHSWLRKDGRIIDCETSVALLKDEEGNAIGAVGSIRDVTERKKSEEALLESEGKYRGVVNNIGIGVSLISPNMEILSLNNQMQQWFPEADVSKKPICYKTFNNPPRERVCSYCPTFKTLHDGQVHESITDTPRDEKVLHYRIISSPLKDKEGKITSAIEMVEDITEQKAAEEKLLYYQKQLKALTSQITLTEEKERKRFAEYLHNEIGQHLFASQIQVEQLKNSFDSKEDTKILDDVINNLKQIIDKSRSLTFELSSPILYELGLKKALEWLGENIHKQYNLVVTLNDDKQEKPLDDDMKMFLYQAVRELLTNVVKHAQTKNALVSIKKENSTIHICVEDNGVGFDPSQEHSLNNSNNRFGLFHISERIEHFGGQIEIESQPNCGTQITLVAPLKNSV
jgi:PAS domain S-box-containing protein